METPTQLVRRWWWIRNTGHKYVNRFQSLLPSTKTEVNLCSTSLSLSIK
ncbi:hypothetical protein LXL04_036252, partial [Taraxacum kok-saghyz]